MGLKRYSNTLTATINEKGVLDIDTIKGCYHGMGAYPHKGCYDACYAYKIAEFRGFNFRSSQLRMIQSVSQMKAIAREIRKSSLQFIRVGTMGDPSYNWEHTISVLKFIKRVKKTPVVITKHWKTLTPRQMREMAMLEVILNTSISALDTQNERKKRIAEYLEYEKMEGKSILRVVTCDFNTDNERGRDMKKVQDKLLAYKRVIDNPLRAPKSHALVQSGIIRVGKHKDLNSEVYISMHDKNVFVGKCKDCPDMCGLNL